jgi:hypothetical protein
MAFSVATHTSHSPLKFLLLHNLASLNYALLGLHTVHFTQRPQPQARA